MSNLKSTSILGVRYWLEKLNRKEFTKAIFRGVEYTDPNELYKVIIGMDNYIQCMEFGNTLTVDFGGADYFDIELK